MMKKFVLLLLFGVFFTLEAAPVVNYSPRDLRLITRLAVRVLRDNHYRYQKLDEEFSRRLYDAYLDELDPEHLYFTQEDLGRWEEQKSELCRQLLRGDSSFAFEVYQLFRKQFTEYRRFIEAELAKPVVFDGSETWHLDRKKAPRPADKNQQQQLWRSRLHYEWLLMRLGQRRMAALTGDKSRKLGAAELNAWKWDFKTPEQKLLSAWRDAGNEVAGKTNIDILGIYLNVFAGLLGPHSNYMAPRMEEDFTIRMSLSLYGIGATLSNQDGLVKVVKIVPGSPADKTGRLFREDRIIAVAQEDGTVKSLIDTPVSQAVQYIRGPENSRVLLGVLSGVPTDDSIQVSHWGLLGKIWLGSAKIKGLLPWRGKIYFRLVSVIRSKVELNDMGAAGKVYEIPDHQGKIRKVGVIDLPSFYMDWEAVRRRDPDARRGSTDVEKILADFQKQNVESVVIDLRRNGGGSLPDVVAMAGLFIKSGAVVQVRERGGRKDVLGDDDEQISYTGPLVVLSSKMSASSSEIFCGAMRDHRRAVLVGDSRTFGKGSVLLVNDLSDNFLLLGFRLSAGSATYEHSMFYRICGAAVQQLGIPSDIRLPSLSEEMEVGEKHLDNHLPYDEVEALPVTHFDPDFDRDVEVLKQLSAERIKESPAYRRYLERIARYRRYQDRKIVVLDEEARWREYLEEAELDEETARLASEERDPEKEAETGGYGDVVLQEAMNIASDYAALKEKK